MPTTRHFLNALRKADRKLPAPAEGVWHEDTGFLEKYASDIDLQGQLSSTQLSHSVPSFFQRPIQFYNSLAEEANPLHVAVTHEWRGLLAAFALSNWLDLNIRVRRFQVPPEDLQASSYVGATGNGSLHFNTILRGQLPKPEHWSDWWLIYADEVLLGATSPWTAVYTAAQYAPSASIPWPRERLLIDPIEHFDPQPNVILSDLAILHNWMTS